MARRKTSIYSSLYDAIAAALTHSARGEWEKRALIVLTDGGDNASSRTLGGVLRFAQESNVTIYTVGLFDPLAAGSNRPVLHKLAALTGGDSYLPERIEELAPVWDEIAHGIRTQYTLGIGQPKPFLTGSSTRFACAWMRPGVGK